MSDQLKSKLPRPPQFIDTLKTALGAQQLGGTAETGVSYEEMLRGMSDEELAAHEDQKLLEMELHGTWEIRVSAGRYVIFVLGIFYFAVFSVFAAALMPSKPSELSGILSILPMGAAFIGGFVMGRKTWQWMGIRGRQFVRLCLHYWPLSFPILFAVIAFAMQLKSK